MYHIYHIRDKSFIIRQVGDTFKGVSVFFVTYWGRGGGSRLSQIFFSHMGGGEGGGAGQNSVFIEKMSQLLWGELCPQTPLIHSVSVSILLILKNFSFHFLKHGKNV